MVLDRNEGSGNGDKLAPRIYSDNQAIDQIIRSVLEHPNNMGDIKNVGSGRWITGLMKALPALIRIPDSSERTKIAMQFQNSYLSPELLQIIRQKIGDEDHAGLISALSTSKVLREYPELSQIYDSLNQFLKVK